MADRTSLYASSWNNGYFLPEPWHPLPYNFYLVMSSDWWTADRLPALLSSSQAGGAGKPQVLQLGHLLRYPARGIALADVKVVQDGEGSNDDVVD
jgi:hypothetical protein